MKENMNNTDILMENETMTIETFTDMIKDALSSHLEDCTMEAQEVRKNNSVILHGPRITEPENNVAPCIYLDNAFREYQNGRDFDEIVTAIVEDYKQNCQISGFDASVITDYERVKEKICFKVVNTDLNKELLADVPHIPFHDLSEIFYVLIDNIPGQNASVLIRNKFLDDYWNVDADTLFDIAKSNNERLLGGRWCQ